MPAKTTMTVHTFANTAHLQAVARIIARHLTEVADELELLDRDRLPLGIGPDEADATPDATA